jgi:hypothetical protein
LSSTVSASSWQPPEAQAVLGHVKKSRRGELLAGNDERLWNVTPRGPWRWADRA